MKYLNYVPLGPKVDATLTELNVDATVPFCNEHILKMLAVSNLHQNAPLDSQKADFAKNGAVLNTRVAQYTFRVFV